VTLGLTWEQLKLAMASLDDAPAPPEEFAIMASSTYHMLNPPLPDYEIYSEDDGVMILRRR
jgi:hypothetical protein